MKNVLIAFLLIPTLCFAQNPISYSGVEKVDSSSKEQLFIRARQWLNETFKSSKDVLQIADKESGELSGKGIITVISTYHSMGEHKYPFDVNFSINIWVKDGKYKYELKNFTGSVENHYLGLLTDQEDSPTRIYGNSKKVSNELWTSIKNGTDKDAKDLIESLKTSMKRSAASDF